MDKMALNKDKRLIIEKLKAPDENNDSKRKERDFPKVDWSVKTSIAFTLVLVSAFGVFPRLTDAGFFSFLGKALGIDSEVKKEVQTNVSLNSQTAILLKAIQNPNSVAGSGGGGIVIVNQSALLPDTGPLGSIADINDNVSNSDRISVYVVREGDSLSQIAKMFDVSVNTIIWANDINRGDLIQTGQVLIILPVTGLRYTVQKGDTLESIAKKYKGDVEEIIRFNDLPANVVLSVGDEVIIPDGEAPYKPTSVYVNSTARGTGGPNYVGYYLRPIGGGVKSQGLHGYNAVDLATYCGAPIFASASGDVVISRSYGWNGGYGNYIAISHSNGTQTLYAHNSKNIVGSGWHVVKGQVIGYIGSTGNSTGCHVHFEIRGAKNPF